MQTRDALISSRWRGVTAAVAERCRSGLGEGSASRRQAPGIPESFRDLRSRGCDQAGAPTGRYGRSQEPPRPMPDSPSPLSKQPLNSLATKLILFVFVSTLATALVVSWISIQSTHDYLSQQIRRQYPASLTHAGEAPARLAGRRAGGARRPDAESRRRRARTRARAAAALAGGRAPRARAASLEALRRLRAAGQPTARVRQVAGETDRFVRGSSPAARGHRPHGAALAALELGAARGGGDTLPCRSRRHGHAWSDCSRPRASRRCSS